MTENKATPQGARRHGKGDDPLGANSEIARKLQQYYNTLVTDAVPDRFAQLLSKLEDAEPRKDES